MIIKMNKISWFQKLCHKLGLVYCPMCKKIFKEPRKLKYCFPCYYKDQG